MTPITLERQAAPVTAVATDGDCPNCQEPAINVQGIAACPTCHWAAPRR